MQLKNDATRYGLVAQALHWAVVALIIWQFVLANRADALPLSPAKISVLATHKSVGITIMALVVLRLIWRCFNVIPRDPPSIPRWQQLAARATHLALYGLLLATPLVGWLMSSARNFPVSWFGILTLPDFIEPSTESFQALQSAHGFMAQALLVLALLHVAAALKHHFIDRDTVLRRMLPVGLK